MTADNQSWRDFAACKDTDPELWMPKPRTEVGVRESRRTVARCKSICAGCPVLLECRGYARASQDLVGVFGGETEDDRKAFRRRTKKLLKDSTPSPIPST